MIFSSSQLTKSMTCDGIPKRYDSLIEVPTVWSPNKLEKLPFVLEKRVLCNTLWSIYEYG